jgi:hypothetical protein
VHVEASVQVLQLAAQALQAPPVRNLPSTHLMHTAGSVVEQVTQPVLSVH